MWKTGHCLWLGLHISKFFRWRIGIILISDALLQNLNWPCTIPQTTYLLINTTTGTNLPSSIQHLSK